MCHTVVHLLPFACLFFSPAVVAAVDDLKEAERFRHVGLCDFLIMPDGKAVLTAGYDGVLRHWDLATGRQKRTVQLQGVAGPDRYVALSPDGKTAAAHQGTEIVFWKVDSGQVLKTLLVPKSKPGFLTFSADGKILAAGTWDLKITLYEWESGNERPLPLPARKIPMDSTFHVGFSPDSKWIVGGGGWNEALSVHELATGREVYRHGCNAYASRISPDSKRLAVSCMRNDKGGRETVIRLFDLESGKELSQFPLGHDVPIFSLAFSPDGKLLACGCSDRGCLLDSATGRVLHRFPGRSWVPAFTPDGKTLVISTSDLLQLWDVATGKELLSRPG